MLPVNSGGHSAYQDTFVSEFLKLFPNPFAVPKETWDLIVKFWYLDLSQTDKILLDYYPTSGKSATRYPSCLLHSYLLSFKLHISSVTKWCRIFKVTQLFVDRLSALRLIQKNNPLKSHTLNLHKNGFLLLSFYLNIRLPQNLFFCFAKISYLIFDHQTLP